MDESSIQSAKYPFLFPSAPIVELEEVIQSNKLHALSVNKLFRQIHHPLLVSYVITLLIWNVCLVI